jgi:hypothetical protein
LFTQKGERRTLGASGVDLPAMQETRAGPRKNTLGSGLFSMERRRGRSQSRAAGEFAQLICACS